MKTRSFVIPASSIPMVEKQFEKLNKRAAKLGLPEITCSFGKAFLQTRMVLTTDPKYPELPPKYLEKDILVVPAEIAGPLSVKFEGWEFVATLQHLPTGENIIRTISDAYDIPKHYREAKSDCQHCNVNRYRKDTYLVCHAETNVFCQVGSSCIKDFLGGNSPDDILKKANLLSDLLSFMDGASNGGGYDGGEIVYPLVAFLAQTVACIRDYGWLSKSKAYEFGGKPTSQWVLDNFNPPRGLKDFQPSIIRELDTDKAIDAAEWSENIADLETDNSDYLYNIRAIARSGMVGYRTAGFAASIMTAYDKELVKRQPKQISQHVGTVKKREIFDVVLKHHFSYDGMYGVSHKYIFHDPNGNVLVWQTNTYQDLEEGSRYGVKGTVKEHGQFKNQAQTILTRCEVVMNYDVGSL